MLKCFLARAAAVPSPAVPDGFHAVQGGTALLATPRRQKMLKMVLDNTSLTQAVFDEYIRKPIERYAALVQLLPASESHHHSYPGGMLDHALESVCYGLKLRQSHLLPPGAKPEDQSSAGELWSAAVIYGALMHDVAKAMVDLEIHLSDGRTWSLWQGNIPAPYRVRYRVGRDYHLHGVVNPALCGRVLGPKVMDWLMTQPKLFSLFMYTIAGHTERGGILGELISQADRASVAKAMGGNPVQALAAPVESLQRKLADGLRYLVREKLKRNKPGAPVWLTEEALWLVTPAVVHELKAHLYDQGIKSLPAELNRLYGEMHAHGLIEEVSEGKHVWACDVQDGDWKKTLSMLKVPPALIWSMEDRPAVFTGKVVVKGAGEESFGTDTAAAQAPSRPVERDPAPHADPQPPGTGQGAQSPSPAAISLHAEKPGTALDDDLMDIFPALGEEGGGKNEEKTDIKINVNEGASTPAENNERAVSISSPASQKSNDGDDLGVMFWHWLKQGINDHSIIINDTKAPVHTVGGTYFLVSPSIFKRFCSTQLRDEGQWKLVQKRFQKLGLHVRVQDQNIHRVSVEGPNKTNQLMGYLLQEPTEISKKIPPDNRVLKLKTNRE